MYSLIEETGVPTEIPNYNEIELLHMVQKGAWELLCGPASDRQRIERVKKGYPGEE